jgi:hypothetical protein
MAKIKYSHPHVTIETIDVSRPVSDVNAGGSSLYAVFESERGLDGKIRKFNSRSKFIQEYGTPNFKKYGQSVLNATNWLAAGGEVYALRVLPDNAKHAHSIMAFYADASDNVIPVTYYNSEVNYTEDELLAYINTDFDPNVNTTPDDIYSIYDILTVYSEARGKYYNKIGFKIERNNSFDNTYAFAMYNVYTVMKKDDGTYDIVEGPLSVSMHPEARTLSGVSLFMPDVINKYSQYLSVEVNEDNLEKFVEDYSLSYNDDLLFGESLSNSEVTYVVDSNDEEVLKLSAYNEDTQEKLDSYKSNFDNLVNYINAGDISDITRIDISQTLDAGSPNSFETAMFENFIDISNLGSGVFETLTNTNEYLVPYKISDGNYVRLSYDEVISQVDELISHYRDIELSKELVYKHRLSVYNNWQDYGLEAQPAEPTNTSASIKNTINTIKSARRNIVSTYLEWSSKIGDLTDLLVSVEELPESGKLKTVIVSEAKGYYDDIKSINDKLLTAIASLDSKAYSLTNETVDDALVDISALETAKDNLNAYSSDSVFSNNLSTFVTEFKDLTSEMKSMVDNSSDTVATGNLASPTIAEGISELQPGVSFELMLEYLNSNANIWVSSTSQFVSGTTTAVTFDGTDIDQYIEYAIDFSNDIDGNLYDLILDDFISAQESLSETTLFNSDEVLIDKGSDGTVDSVAERNDLIRSGFTGEIEKKKEYPVDVILDANYSDIVKNQIVTLVSNYRDDVMAYLDEGIKYPSTASLSLVDRASRFSYDTYDVAIHSQNLITTDPYTLKDIKVTPTYYLSTLIPRNDIENGIQYPLAGLSRGVISLNDYKQLSFNPTMQEKSNLYDAQVNYIEQDPRRAKFSTQLTTQKRRSALSFVNNARVVKRIRREVEDIAERYIQEFNDDTTLSAMSSAINENLKQWKENRACSKIDATVYASEYDRQNGIVRVTIEAQFTGIIEIVAIDLVVQ